MGKNRRKINLVVLSDIHLGTYGCHAKELYSYLKSIKPKMLVLNGDIIDIWQFSKHYWPKHHMKVVKQILNFGANGTIVYYITGNHDETLRRFSGLKIGNVHIVNKLELTLNGQNVCFFHGDVFDIITRYSKWLAKLGAKSYDTLILLNILINKITKFLGKGKVSLSKKIKENVKSAVKYINNFEETIACLAIRKNYDAIICGHIHQPEDRMIKINTGKEIRYLNSGDWVENLTALEYNNNKWKIFHYRNDFKSSITYPDNEEYEYDTKKLFHLMLDEFQN